MRGHAQALGDIGDRFAFLVHLFDRFDLEFFGGALTTHGASYLGLIMRLGAVYDSWELNKAGAERAPKRAAPKKELFSPLSDFFHSKTASVKIHNADGTIEEERTYPRSADPRRSKG